MVETATVNTRWMVDDRARGIFRVHRAAFYDSAVWEAEIRHIFEQCWLYVGHESEIPEPGDFIRRTVGGRDILFVRAPDRRPTVLFNSCPHQGAIVCRLSRGRTRQFQCFYHGWTFDVTGKILGLPGGGYSEHLPREALSLARPAQVASYRGFVFMHLQPDAEPLESYLDGAKDFLDMVADQSEAGMVVTPGDHPVAIRANWKVLASNSVDGYHVAATHQSYFEFLRNMGMQLPPRRQYLGRGLDLGHGHVALEFEAPWGRASGQWVPFFGDAVREEIMARRRQWEQRFGPERARRMAEFNRNVVIFPNLILNDLVAISIRTFFPVRPDYLELTWWSLAPADESPALRAVRQANYLSFWGPVGWATPDDVEAFELCQRGFANREVAWTDVSKGMLRETEDYVPDYTDELQQRAFWRHWYRLMAPALAGLRPATERRGGQ